MFTFEMLGLCHQLWGVSKVNSFIHCVCLNSYINYNSVQNEECTFYSTFYISNDYISLGYIDLFPKAWFTLGSSYALFPDFIGFCNPYLKLGLLSILYSIHRILKYDVKILKNNQHFIKTNRKTLRSFKVNEIFV